MSKPHLLVSAIILMDDQARILLAQRPEGKEMAGLWEFPGGKIEENETPEQALVREIKEELNITIQEDALSPLSFASHTYEKFHLLMPTYLCTKWEGKVQAMEGQNIAWVTIDKLTTYPMPPADKPLIEAIQHL